MNVHSRQRRIAGGIATVAIAALSLAACSSSGGGSKASSGASASGSTVKIFAYSDITVPAPAPANNFIEDISTATVKAINAAGGINGKQIQMTFCDSKLNPTATLACVKQATSGNYAAVIVPNSNAGVGGADAQLAKAGVPIFYGLPVPGQTTLANAVCATSTSRETGLATGYLAKNLGVTKLGRAHIDYPIFAQGTAQVATGLKENGINIGSDVTTPVSTTDMSSVFAQAMSGGANGLWYAASGPVLSPSIKQFLATYPGKPLIAQVLQTDTVKNVGSAADGHLYAPVWTQPITSNVTGAKQFVAAMTKYASDPSSDIASTYIPFALPFNLFAGIAKTIKGGITSSSVLAAMKTATNVSMGGLVPNYNGSQWGKVGAACLYQTDTVPLVAKNGDLVTVYKAGMFLDTTTNKLVGPTS